MFTLIVDSYGQKYKKQVPNYLALVARFSDLRLIQEGEATPDYDMSGIDAVVLSGSEKCLTKGEYDETYLEFIRKVGVPLLGVCYGHQALALAYGQEVTKKSKYVRRKFPKQPEKVRIAKCRLLFAGMGSTMLSDESHWESITLVDRKFELLAYSKSCSVEAIKLKSADKFGVQFHLERSGEYGVAVTGNFYRIVRRKKRR